MKNKSLNEVNSLRYWSIILLWRHRNRVMIGALLVFLTAAFAMALLALSGWFITATALAGISVAAGAMLALDIYLPGSGIRFFALGRTVSRYMERLYNHDSVLRQLSLIRQQLFKGLSTFRASELKKQTNADWLSRLTADLDSMDSLLLRLLLPPCAAVLGLLLLSLLVSFWSYTAALFLFTSTLFLSCMIFILFLRLQQNDSKALVTLFNSAREEFINHMNGLPELRCAKMQEHHQQGLLIFTNQFNKLQCRLVSLQANVQLAINTLHSIMVLVAAICSIKGAQEGLFDAPVAVLLVLAVFAFGELLQLLPGQLGVLGRTRYAAERLYPLANPAEETKDTSLLPQKLWNKLDIHLSGHPYIPASLKQMLTLEFSAAKPYLLVTGRSGSGKSTLAELILGEAHEQSEHLGTIACFKLDGQNVSSEQYSLSLQEGTAYLSQRNSILADTLFINVTLGLPDISDEKVWQVLRLVELDEWAKSLPADLDSWLGDTGQELSGGQARRICLARLLLRAPHLVVLDEPFNGLDESMAERIWRNIAPWLADKYVMLLVHKSPDFVSSDLLPQQHWQHLQFSSEDE